MRHSASLLVGTLLAAMPLAPVAAQTAAPDQHVLLDLNALQPSEGGCRLTFVVTNNLATPVERAAYEMALFDKGGVVERLTVLDFKTLPAGKTKVSRFDLKGVDCAGVSRVLINDATDCSGAGTAPDACVTALRTVSTSGVTFGR